MDRDSPWSTSTPSHLSSDQPAAALSAHAAVANSSNPSTAATNQTPHRDLPPSSASAAPPPALPATFNPAAGGSSAKYDAYGTPSIASRTANLSLSTPAGSGTHTPRDNTMAYTHNGDLDGDMPMEDADPYNKQKYARATSNSNSNRNSQYLPAQQPEDATSRTASRYSPMNTSPTSPYLPAPQQQQQQQQVAGNQYSSYTPQQSARQSPSRQNPYASPTSSQRYYASPPSSARAHSSQLPPLQPTLSPTGYFPQSATQQLNAVFGREAGSPGNTNQPHQQPPPAGSRGIVPQMTKVHNVLDLKPQVNSQPPFRRANPEGGFISPLQALTTHLPATYRICNPAFQYESSRNPRRVLTKPSKGVKNDGYDNEDSDYILYVNDILGSEETNHKNRYLILDVLGQGTFGQVVKCQNLKTQEVVAVKVVKNKTAYFNQSMMEVSVLDLLNGRMDKNDDHHILRLKDTFIHKQHLCLVFELLSVNLYELIKQNQFRGLSTTLVRVFAQQLLNGLCLLNKAKLIHCDLKPENILLKK
jgi:dual specificity protein kinase YAK1